MRRERSHGYAWLRTAPHGPSAPPGGAVGEATLRAARREFRRRRQRAEGSRPGEGRAGAGRRWVLGPESERAARRLRIGPPGRDRPHISGSFLSLLAVPGGGPRSRAKSRAVWGREAALRRGARGQAAGEKPRERVTGRWVRRLGWVI